MSFLDLVFPKKCIGCGNDEGYLCEDCLLHAPKQWLCCPECKKPSPLGNVHDLCKTEFGLDGLISIYKYRGVIRKIIGKLKNSFAYDLADPLANIISSNLINFVHFHNPIIIPIPLHLKRKNWRGFNQSEELAKILSKKLNWELNTTLIVRTKFNKPQTTLKYEERARNICGEFAVNDHLHKDINQSKTIILFDDFWTTGSTIREACKELKKRGFKKVWGVTISR